MILRFFDTETRSRDGQLKATGVDPYLDCLEDLSLVTWQDLTDTQKSPVHVWEPMFSPPPEFTEVDYWVAWNSRFDRLVWNHMAPKYGVAELPIRKVMDLAAMAMASGLPGRLADCARVMRLGGKKAPDAMRRIEDASTPIDMSLWPAFVEYGRRDTELLFQIYRRLPRLLGPQEWEEFWASEEINDRGMRVDLELARAAQKYAGVERDSNTEELRRLIGADDITLFASQRINRWIYDELPEDLKGLMVSRYNDEDEPVALSLDSKRVLPELIEALDQEEGVDHVREVLELLSYARGSAVSKFKTIQDRACKDGRVRGSYLFDGAITGRFSARGLQVHNMPRDTASAELIAQVKAGAELDTGDVPVAKALKGLLRPTIVAGPGNVLVWGDWSAIEARVLPWLAKEEGLLDLFREGRDVYVDVASEIFGTDDVSKEQRQAGKVAVLALGFGGSVGAYRAMARGYGMKVDDAFAMDVVQGWRRANPWALAHWEQLWNAFTSALQVPNRPFYAGRVCYVCNDSGDVYAFLPSGRALVYMKVRKETRRDEKTGKVKTVHTYQRGLGRSKLWHGTLAENNTQAEAASLLRGKLVVLQDVVGHTHDEVIQEVAAHRREEAMRALQDEMEKVPAWAAGLPLNAGISSGTTYGKQQ